ncbi:hypothetical protein B0H13DRAFT_1917158 [Mycena leptocephala]|nr:hypothetical protein B0H13DRAFT_1917158 [Mycena leptocephala]
MTIFEMPEVKAGVLLVNNHIFLLGKQLHIRGIFRTLPSDKLPYFLDVTFGFASKECDAISERLDDLAQIACDAKKGTNYKFLIMSHDQLRELLIEWNEQLNKLKLESLNLGRRLATFARKMDDIETAMRNGASVRKLPAYMMHLKAFIMRKPTIGPISKDEIRANIQNVMLEPRRETAIPHTACQSVTIMMNEVAIEEQACYFSYANQVGGLCQKHSTISLNLATHDSALRIVDELSAERIHFGKEMEFVATLSYYNYLRLAPYYKAPGRASVESLLNPDDPQEVPRAIDLLEAIVALRTPHFVHAGSTATCPHRTFMLEAFLNVITLPSASLSEQIYHLSIYAHMSFILFPTYRLKYMSSQLYGDCEAARAEAKRRGQCHFVAKSKNRGERAMGLAIKKVRTYTKPNGIRPLSGSITGASFITRDPFATLVRTSTNVSLAIMGLREMPLLKEALAGFPYSWSTGIPALLSDSGMASLPKDRPMALAFIVPRSPELGQVATYENFEMRGIRARQSGEENGKYTNLSAAQRPEFRNQLKLEVQIRGIIPVPDSEQGSATTPSRNSFCRLCPTLRPLPDISSSLTYNMGQHLRDIHPEYAPLQPEGDLLPFKVAEWRIDKKKRWAWCSEFWPRPFTNFVRDSDEPTRGESEGRDLANGAGRNGSTVDAEASIKDKTLPSVIIDDVPPSFDLIGWPLRRYWASGIVQASRVNPAK